MTNNFKELSLIVLDLLWKPLLQTCLVLFILASIYISWASFVLTMLVVNLSFKLFDDVPNPKVWLSSIGVTVFVTSVLFWFFKWFSGYGLLGVVFGLLVLVGYKIYQGWSMFDMVTTWGAERIRGKHSKGFDFDKLKEEGKRK